MSPKSQAAGEVCVSLSGCLVFTLSRQISPPTVTGLDSSTDFLNSFSIICGPVRGTQTGAEDSRYSSGCDFKFWLGRLKDEHRGCQLILLDYGAAGGGFG